MTAWGDQPPLSRRQVRMNARVHEGGAELSDTSGAAGNVDVDTDPAEQSVPFDTFPPAVPVGGDAAASRFDEPSAASTSGIRPGSRRAMRLAETGRIDLSGQPGFEDSSAFRVRDFRPAEPQGLATPQVPPTPQENSDAVAAPEEAAPSETPQPSFDLPAGRPLTRRELRALEAARAREAEEAEQPAPSSAPVQLDPPPLVEPPRSDLFPSTLAPESVSPELQSAEPIAPESREVFTNQGPAAAPAAPGVPVSGGQELPVPTGADLPEPLIGSLAKMAPPVGVPFGTSPTQVPTLADLPAPPPPAGPDTETFVPQYSLAHYPPPVMLPDSPESARGIDLSPQQQAAATGHWTTQEALDDAGQPAESVTTRDIGVATGPITSSALVLPAIPDGSDLSVPFSTTTGEVLITGSINLPSTLGTTGAHPSRYDHSDLDAIIEASDRDDAAGESAPVRAVRAVSTHTSPRDVIAVSRTAGTGNRLPIVLAITAGAMMVSVTVLVVAGFVSGTF